MNRIERPIGAKSSGNSDVRFDVDRARRETPGCADVIHLNNAGAALPPTCVTQAVIEHLRLEARIGGYEAAEQVHAAVERTYDAIADLVSCHRDEIAVVENATRGWDMAFYAMSFAAGDRILTCRSEYASNVIAMLQVAAGTGATVEIIDDDESGQVSLEDLRRRIDHTVKLIALTHVPTQGGLVNPAAGVGQIARDAGIPFLLDACQSAGQLPLDVQELGCDMMSATGRKYLRAPRGTGFLYVRREFLDTLEPPFLDLYAARWAETDRYITRSDARKFESWECNYSTKIGLGVAVEYALEWGIDDVERRVVGLATRLRRSLELVDGVTIRDQGSRRCGIVTFTVAGIASADIQQQLRAADINTSVSLVQYALLDLRGRDLPDLVRASVHYYNTDQEIDTLVDELTRIIARRTR